MQIKAMRYQNTPTRTAKIWKLDNSERWWGCGAVRILIHWWWECKMAQPLWRTVWWFLTKLILLPYSLATTLLVIRRGWKLTSTQNPDVDILIAAPFIIINTWKQPTCPVGDEQTNCGTSRGFPGGSDGKKKIFLQFRRPRFNPWVGKISWRREWLPTPLFLPREFHGQRSLIDLQSMES